LTLSINLDALNGGFKPVFYPVGGTALFAPLGNQFCPPPRNLRFLCLILCFAPPEIVFALSEKKTWIKHCFKRLVLLAMKKSRIIFAVFILLVSISIRRKRFDY
jgi:hypothetical protein